MTSKLSRIGVASDHAGKELKTLVVDFLRMTANEIVDYGVSVDTDASVDYPDYAHLLATAVATTKVDRGIVICGTGIGMSIVANKVPGIRAAVVWDEFSTRMSRAHNDANVLCLGSRALNYHRAVDLVKIWLETPFEGGRHEQRLNKIRDFEKKSLQIRLST